MAAVIHLAVLLSILGSATALSSTSVRAEARFRVPSDRQSLSPLRCEACSLSGPDAARLFIHERSDGAGAVLHNIIYGMAVAAKRGLNFGGVLAHPHESHNVDVERAVTEFFGEDIFVRSKPRFDVKFETVADLEAGLSEAEGGLSLPPNSSILLDADSMVKASGLGGALSRRGLTTIDDYLSPAFLAALKRGLPWLNQRALEFEPGKTPVALHVRRGDIGIGGKWTSDQEYSDLVERIRKQLPSGSADLHVFSESRGFNASEYERQHANVHLDGRDLLGIWAHMAHAQVLVVARSSFSWVPAFLNEHCVIYKAYGDGRRPLEAWAPSDDAARVDACVAKARSRDL